MNAIVSGRSGRALILDGESLRSFDFDEPFKIVPRHRSDLPYLFGEASDLRFLEKTNIESVERELRLDCHFTWALDLTLISLDSELEDDIRKEALEELEELFKEDATVVRVENVLYSKPLRDDADIEDAVVVCESKGLSTVLVFLQRLESYQSVIENCYHAWESIPTKVFGNDENRKAFNHTAIQEGLYRDLVTLDPSVSVSSFLLKPSLNKSIQALPNYRQVLQAWIAPFRQSRKTPDFIQEEDEDDRSERFGKRVRINRRAAFREAVLKKSVIVEAMHRRDLARVEYLIDELVSYHQRNSESRHTAKSLCDLAMEAKSLGMHSLQLILTERSISIAPDDSWAWAQYGDALLRMERLNESYEAYRQAQAFGAGSISKKGKGEVLKAKGHFDAALAVFDEVIAEHPNDDVAKNGRAEVLKALGQFDDAIAAFDEVIKQDPENVVAKNGRAEVLKAQGQFDGALAAFDAIIKQHPENVVAKNGRAEVLKAQGQFDLALAGFDEVIKQHPENVVAKNGRAELLKGLGQFDLALAAFDEVIKQHPENVVAMTGRAEVLKAEGQLDGALAAFDEVIKQHPESVIAKAGRAEVLKAEGQLDGALAAFDKVIKQHPENVVAKTGRAEVLKAQGRFDMALAAFDQVIKQHPQDVVAKTGRAEVLKAQGRFDLALAAFDQVIKQHPQDIVAKTGRAEVLKARGQFDHALTAFDEVLKNNPYNRIARNGRSSVLVALGRFKDALESLPGTTPIDVQDWIAYHVRGMCLLRLGNTAEALKIFNHGIQNSPFPSTWEYFRSALALSWLRGRDFRKAAETLDTVTSALLQPSANVIRIHAFGAQGNYQRALQAYKSLSATPYLLTDELTQELHLQYVLQKSPTKNEEWVFDREVQIFLRAA